MTLDERDEGVEAVGPIDAAGQDHRAVADRDVGELRPGEEGDEPAGRQLAGDAGATDAQPNKARQCHGPTACLPRVEQQVEIHPSDTTMGGVIIDWTRYILCYV